MTTTATIRNLQGELTEVTLPEPGDRIKVAGLGPIVTVTRVEAVDFPGSEQAWTWGTYTKRTKRYPFTEECEFYSGMLAGEWRVLAR